MPWGGLRRGPLALLDHGQEQIALREAAEQAAVDANHRQALGVQADERGVVLRLGKYVRTSEPGLHFALWPVERMEKPKVEAENQINFGTNDQTTQHSAGYANLPGTSGVKDKVYLYLANDQTTNNDAGMQVGGYGWLTALHEIGHTLGLKHPGNYNAGGGGAAGPFLPTPLDAHQYSIMSYKDNDVSRPDMRLGQRNHCPTGARIRKS